MRVVFMGTPDIAATCLKQIIADGFEVVGVYTQPDRPKNRGMKLAFSPVKEVALENDIPVFQPENFRDEDTVQQFIFQERDSIVSSFHSVYNFLDMLLRDEHTVSKYEQGVCVFRCLMLGLRDKSARHRTLSEKQEIGTTSLSAFKHFMQLLNQHSKTTHSVKAYADMLHISPQYLGRICRMYDGRGPKEMVDDILLLQLKSSLKNTEKTMKELCYEYNFPTLSFMCSFFRRHTGHTPTEFRSMYREGML